MSTIFEKLAIGYFPTVLELVKAGGGTIQLKVELKATIVKGVARQLTEFLEDEDVPATVEPDFEKEPMELVVNIDTDITTREKPDEANEC
jgi:hypothetical protein